MNKKVVYYSSNHNNYITITSNGNACVYTWYKDDQARYTSFNKWAFIDYLKGCRIPKKYLKEVEAYD